MCEQFPHIVICDFDGTITTEDTFWGLVNNVCSKELVLDTMERFYKGETIMIDACLSLIESIPASDLHKVDAYIEMMRIRPGFDEFVRYLKDIEVPLIVLSGGLDYTVQGRLAPYKKYIHAFYSAVLDTSKEYLTVLSPCMEPYSFLDKSTVLERLNADVFIGIGDGVTDLTIARSCHHMFARDKLLAHMNEKKLSCIGWNDFYDVIDHMKNHIFV